MRILSNHTQVLHWLNNGFFLYFFAKENAVMLRSLLLIELMIGWSDKHWSKNYFQFVQYYHIEQAVIIAEPLSSYYVAAINDVW